MAWLNKHFFLKICKDDYRQRSSYCTGLKDVQMTLLKENIMLRLSTSKLMLGHLGQEIKSF